MSEWELVYYETANGRCPVRDYLLELSAEDLARVLRELDLLEEYGTQLAMPRVRRLRDTPLRELRIRGRNQYRVFYAAVSGHQILLLHAFQKKSQQTPRREIQTGEGRLKDYQERFDQ